MTIQVKNSSSGNNKSLSRKQVIAGSRKVWMTAGLSVVILVIILSVIFFLKKDEVVAYVDGEPILAKELNLQVSNNKALVSAYFYSKYNADSSEGFWTTDFGGEIPADRLMKDAMDNAVHNKVLQIMAKERGVVTEINYSNLMDNMSKENKNRKKALKNKEVVIGAEQYDAKTYYDLSISNLANDLMDAVSTDLTISDEDIQARYEADKDKYVSQDDITIGKLSVSYADGKNTARENAQSKVQEIEDQLNSGATLAQIKEGPTEEVSYEEIKLGSAENRNLSLVYPILFQKSLALNPGQFSGVFEEDNAFNIVICINRVSNGTQTLEDVKDNIKETLIQEQFGKMVDQRIAKAKVKINDNVYNKIKEDAIR